MVMCKIGEDGFIDFSGLSQHCKEARSLAKQSPQSSVAAPKASSSSMPIQPLRPSDAHKMMAEAQQQTKIVRDKERELKAFFETFDSGADSTQTFKNNLMSLNLKITGDLEALLRKSECSDTPYGEVSLFFLRRVKILEDTQKMRVKRGACPFFAASLPFFTL